MHYIFLSYLLLSGMFFSSIQATSSYGNNPPVKSIAAGSMSSFPESSEKNQYLAKNLILSLYDAAKTICEDKKTSESEKISQLTRLVESFWDVPQIAQYVIWPHWKSFSKNEKQEFIKLLTNNIVRTFQKVSKKYLGYLKIKKVVPIQKKENTYAYAVYCEVLNKEDGMKAEVCFQVVSQRIRNLLVEKLDLVAAKKMDYAALMRKNRQSYPAFLKALQNQSTHN